MKRSSELRAEGLGPAAIAVILLLGTAVSVLLSLNLRRQQELEIDAQTDSRASALARLGISEIDRLYADLQRRGAFWAELAATDPAAVRVEVFMEENPAVIAVAYPPLMKEVAASQEAREILERWQAQELAPDTIVGPTTLSDGRSVMGANLRISYLGGEQRAILAVYEPAQRLRSLFAEAASGFGFALSANGQLVLSHDSASPDADLAAFAKTVAIDPRIGEPWALTVWPLPAAVPESYRQGPIVALASGLLASVLIAMALHLGALAWRRSKILSAANAALERQIDDTERGKGELEELSAALAARVAARTAELNETIADLETFNYSVSHDLRSPLAAIINFSAIFSEDYAGRLDDTQKEYLQRIMTSASSAVGMMDALLSYSHSGRTELRRVELDVERLVREVVGEASAAWPTRPCDVKVGTLPNAFADETILRFIFANLISNACKFAKTSESAKVEIGGQIEATEIVYFVRDEGIGFDPRFAAKLFRPFERLHRANEYEGQGVGLAIVARMVRRHGGRVWAQGAVDKGATFYFTIPTLDGEKHGTREI
jgi:signal transduction histidine kinase